MRTSLGIGYGVTPSLTIGALSAGVALRHARVELTGELVAPADDPQTPSIVTLGRVGLSGCATPGRPNLRFPLCAGLGVGALRVGDRSGRLRVTHRAWPAANASAGLVWRFHRVVALWTAAETLVGLRTVEVELQDGHTFRAGPAAVRALLGIELHFSSRAGTRAGKSSR